MKNTIASTNARIDELEKLCLNLAEELAAHRTSPPRTRGARDYGPSSVNEMTALMAYRIRYGDLTSAKPKDIANDHGLSRGQVYSVRGTYTFTSITEDSFDMDDEGNYIEA